MNKATFLTTAFIGLTTSLCGQQLYMERTFGGARFETDSLALSMQEVLEVMRDNPHAVDEFRRARSNYSISGVLGFAGGLLVAVPLITAVVGGKPEWSLAAAGGALILVSIPFTRSFYRHAENALEDYNRKYATLHFKTYFCLTGSGAGIVLRF